MGLKHWQTKSGYKIIQILSGRSNVFLLSNNDKKIIIDTSPKSKWKKLNNRLRSINIDRIDYLILTHSHYDHADNAHRIKETYKAKVIIHKNEAPYLTSGIMMIPKGSNFLTRFLVNNFAKKIAPKLGGESCQFDIAVDEKFDLGDFGFNAFIMYTPGHSDGSVCIIVDDEIAIVGDTMVGVSRWSVFPPFVENFEQLMQSWGKLLETNCSLFLPSHGSANSRVLLQKDYNKRMKKRITL